MPRAALALLFLACSHPPPKPVVGTGAFEAAFVLDGGEYPFVLVAGDFDADGVPTLIVGDVGPESAFAWELRDGVWQTRATPIQAGARMMIAADVDGDERPELISANTRVFGFVPGQNGWREKLDWSTGETVFGLAAGPLRPGPAVELVVSTEANDFDGNLVASHLSLFERKGDALQAFASFPTPCRCETPAVVDFDGDGAPEVVCPAYRTSEVLVVEQRDGGFVAPLSVPARGVPDRSAACDLDGDGKQEALVTSRSEGALVLRRAPDGGFAQTRLLDGLTWCSELQCGDFDGDGDGEVAAYCDGALRVLQVDASGVTTTVSFPVEPGGRLLLSDVTGDGVADLVVAELNLPGAVHIFRAVTRER